MTAENDIDAKLGKEVDADESKDHKPSHVIAEAEALRHISKHRHKEDPAAEQKNAGVHDRADDGRGDGRERAVFRSEPRIYDPRHAAAGNALYEHREQRSRHTEGEKRRGVAREQYHHAENKAEPQPGCSSRSSTVTCTAGSSCRSRMAQHSPAAPPYTAAPTTMGSATSDTETGPNRMKLPSSCKMTISAVKSASPARRRVFP